jgi:hypothetical protein
MPELAGPLYRSTMSRTGGVPAQKATIVCALANIPRRFTASRTRPLIANRSVDGGRKILTQTSALHLGPRQESLCSILIRVMEATRPSRNWKFGWVLYPLPPPLKRVAVASTLFLSILHLLCERTRQGSCSGPVLMSYARDASR